MKPINLAEYKDTFFEVLATTENSQIGVMTLKPGQKSGGQEAHSGDQVVYIMAGEGIIRLDEANHQVHQGTVLTIPCQTKHQIINDSNSDLFLLSVYAPPAY